MKTQCNCHVLFCFLSLTLLAAQVSVCKQSRFPFHSAASPARGTACDIFAHLQRSSQNRAAKNNRNAYTVLSPPQPAKGVPAQQDSSSADHSHLLARSCKTTAALWPPSCFCTTSLPSLGPCSYWQGERQGVVLSFPWWY